MKYSFIFLILICAGLMILGCERKGTSEASPEVFDPEVDPYPSVLDTGSKPDLIGDQAVISRRVERSKPVSALKPMEAALQPSAEASREPIDQVTQKIAQVIDFTKAGNKEGVLELFVAEDAEQLRLVMLGTKQIQKKAAAFEKLVLDRLGLQMPDETKSALAGQSEAVNFAGGITGASVDDLKFEQVGADVLVTDPDGMKMTFTLVGSQYKTSLPVESRKLLEAVNELITAQGLFIDQMTEGISSGLTGPGNFDEARDRIASGTTAPAMEKFMQMFAPATEETSESEQDRTEFRARFDRGDNSATPRGLKERARRVTAPRNPRGY